MVRAEGGRGGMSVRGDGKLRLERCGRWMRWFWSELENSSNEHSPVVGGRDKT